MRRRLLPIGLFGLWLVCLIGWVGSLLIAVSSPSVTCELAPASSIYGIGDWSWIPPGLNCTYCTYRLGEEGRVTVPPPASQLAVAFLLLAWPVSMALLLRSRRHASKV